MSELEKHLIEMGLFEPIKIKPEPQYAYLEKGYFNDPRDANGEVPF
jgi:hypothetical protein